MQRQTSASGGQISFNNPASSYDLRREDRGRNANVGFLSDQSLNDTSGGGEEDGLRIKL